MSYETYFLDDTPNGHERLSVLNALYNDGTRSSLLAAGLTSGQRVLEIGTGTGALTREIADIVGPEGTVVTVDRSAKQVDAFNGSGAPGNVEAKNLSVSELFNLNEQFDFVIGRWILLHMTDTAAAMQSMAGRVRAGGILALEDCTTSTAFCHPSTPAFENFINGWLKLSDAQKLAADAGDALPALFEQVGCRIAYVSHQQPLLSSEQERALPAHSLAESRAAHVDNGILSEAEVDQIVSDLHSLSNSAHQMAYVRNTFVAGVCL